MRPEDTELASGENQKPVVPGGGQAFPYVAHEGWKIIGYGMSQRDYLAAKAMQAMIEGTLKPAQHSEFIAESAYAIADAMIAEKCKVIEES